MTTDRKTMLLLLALDFAAGIIVFNIIGSYWGISSHIIFGP